VSGANAVYGGIARPAQVPLNGPTLSLRATKPISYEDDQLDGVESSSSLYDLNSLAPTIFSGGRSPSHDPPKDFGKKGGLRPDKQMPPELLADHTNSDPGEEVQHPGDFSRSGHAYVRELQDRERFNEEGGFSRLKVRSDAPKPNTPEPNTSNPRIEFSSDLPRIEFGPEQFAQALAFLKVMGNMATVVVRNRAVSEALSEAARFVPSSVQPELYTWGTVRPVGVASKPLPTLQLIG